MPPFISIQYFDFSFPLPKNFHMTPSMKTNKLSNTIMQHSQNKFYVLVSLINKLLFQMLYILQVFHGLIYNEVWVMFPVCNLLKLNIETGISRKYHLKLETLVSSYK